MRVRVDLRPVPAIRLRLGRAILHIRVLRDRPAIHMQTTRYLRARHSLPVESPDILHNGHRYRHVPFLPERRPAATGREQTLKQNTLGTQVAVYEDSIGQLILQWLRKPEYWSEGSSGTQALWHAYTPESVTPSELALSRQACGVACDAQPVIKGTLPNRDIAHMAATSLGYLTWGVTNDPMDYGLGDLGGWALDLLQIWGSYLANAPEEDLASWLHTHLGEQDARMGFSYSDVLADCDAWLLAQSMQSNSSERSLSTAMRDMFAQSETNRIKRFYQSRFKGSADNLVIAFRKLVDGIDLGIFDNVSGSKKALLIASHADRLPSQAEAGILALSYAESLENPNR